SASGTKAASQGYSWLPRLEAQKLFTQFRQFGYGILFFLFLRITGKGVTFRRDFISPAIDPPLAERLVLLLCRHHGDILGDTDFIGTSVGADTMGQQAVKYQQVACL